MAPSLVTGGAINVNETQSTSKAFNKPANAVLAIVCLTAWTGAGGGTLTPSGGEGTWTTLLDETFGTSRTVILLKYINGDATGTTYTFTWGGGATWSTLRAHCIEDCALGLTLSTVPFDSAGATSSTYPSVTVNGVANDYFVSWFGNSQSYTTGSAQTGPTGFTETGDDVASIAALDVATTGSITAQNATYGESTDLHTVAVAIAPVNSVLVQNTAHQSGASDTGPISFNFSSIFTPTAGNRLIVLLPADDDALIYTSPTDDQSNTYTEIASVGDTNSVCRAQTYISEELSGTMPTTISFTGSGQQYHVVLLEVSGVHATTPIELIRTVTNSGSATSISITGIGTVTDNGSLAVALVAVNNGLGTANTVTGWTFTPGVGSWANISFIGLYRPAGSGFDPDVTATWTTSQRAAGQSFVIRPVATGTNETLNVPFFANSNQIFPLTTQNQQNQLMNVPHLPSGVQFPAVALGNEPNQTLELGFLQNVVELFTPNVHNEGEDLFEPILSGNGSLADQIKEGLISQGFLTGSLVDRERARLIAKLTLVDSVNLSMQDLYDLAGEENRIAGLAELVSY